MNVSPRRDPFSLVVFVLQTIPCSVTWLLSNLHNMATNYAHESGIFSVAAAISFAALYGLFFFWFLYMSFRRPIHIHYGLALFCATRVTAFSMRAVLAGSESAGEKLAFLDANQIVFSVGFLILLYTSHKFVLELEYLTKQPLPRNYLYRFLSSHWLFHILLVAAVATTIATACTSDGNGTNATSDNLEIASAILFLALTLLQAFQTIVFAWIELSAKDPEASHHSFIRNYGVFILLSISMLFLVREGFLLATMTDYDKYLNEHFLYPLVIVPQFIIVVLYTTPNLIPARERITSPAGRF